MAHDYSMKNTLHQILKEAAPEISLFFPKVLVTLVPEDLRDRPMEEWADNFIMPWGFPFPARDLVEDANMIAHQEEYWDFVPLWDPEHFTVDSNDIHSITTSLSPPAVPPEPRGRRPRGVHRRVHEE